MLAAIRAGEDPSLQRESVKRSTRRYAKRQRTWFRKEKGLVWCDAGAYFGGRAWGKHKLAPRISPGKTIEGAVAGVVVGTIAALLMKAIFDSFWPMLSRALVWEAAVLFGIAISLIAILGDLVESLLKRDAQTKDAGSLLPGMGGILDRIDSPLLGVPIMYYMLLLTTWLRMGPP